MQDISLREQLRRARVTANEALPHWGLADKPLKVLRNLQNTTFKVGDSHILRLSHPGYQSDRAIASEVALLDYLSRAGLPVPRAQRPDTGEPFIKIDGDRAVVFPILPGRFANASFTPPRAGRQGELVARFHEASMAYAPDASFSRLTVTPDTLLAGVAGDDAEGVDLDTIRMRLGKRDAAIIERSADLVRATWETLGSDHVVHTDITPWNTMWSKGGPVLLDFDDMARGPLAYDLGVVRCEYDDLPESDALWEAFLDGYTSIRPLPDGLPEGLAGVVAGRHLLFATWLVLNIDHPAFGEARDWIAARISALDAILRAAKPANAAA